MLLTYFSNQTPQYAVPDKIQRSTTAVIRCTAQTSSITHNIVKFTKVYT